MSTLRNARHERFAQEIVAGKSAVASYRAAGYKADRRTAWQARHRPDVSRRIEELVATEREHQKQALAEAMGRYQVTAERVIGELARIGFANIRDLIEIDADGEPRVNLVAIPRDEAAALQELTVEQVRAGRVGKTQRGTRVKIKLADKRAALVDLGRHLGLFVDVCCQSNLGCIQSVPCQRFLLGLRVGPALSLMTRASGFKVGGR
jgi:phage terminase small subunit